jgi:hypothetical protein
VYLSLSIGTASVTIQFVCLDKVVELGESCFIYEESVLYSYIHQASSLPFQEAEPTVSPHTVQDVKCS